MVKPEFNPRLTPKTSHRSKASRTAQLGESAVSAATGDFFLSLVPPWLRTEVIPSPEHLVWSLGLRKTGKSYTSHLGSERVKLASTQQHARCNVSHAPGAEKDPVSSGHTQGLLAPPGPPTPVALRGVCGHHGAPPAASVSGEDGLPNMVTSTRQLSLRPWQE